MDTITRRRFLLASGVAGAGALAAGATQVSWGHLAGHAQASPLPPGAAVLVLVTLYGGNDGLSTVVPYADPAYHDARPELAYQQSEVLPLDDALGLNPGLTGLHKLWQAGGLAIVRGVGYPKPDHSHFRSMDIWQTASPDRPVSTGWIGRWLDVTGPDPLRAVSLGATLPPLAVGEKVAAAALPVGPLRLPGGPVGAGLKGLAAPDSTDAPAQALAARSTADLLSVSRVLGPALSSAGASTAGNSSLAAQLGVVGRCVKAGVPTRAYAVSLGGFDTHAEEKPTQSALLTEVDSAVSGFLTDMQADDRGKGVVLAVYSEFGRRVKANASQGTDHGTAGVVFVAGQPVRGGFYGDQPSLTRLDQGDLQVTTDFRSVYGTLLEKVLGTEAGRVIDGPRPTLGFL